MKISPLYFFIFLVFTFQSCTKEINPTKPEDSEPIITYAQTIGDGSGNPIYIGENFTFKNNPYANVDYIIKDWIIILDSTTTIEPGCVIYFEGSHAGMITQGNGAIYAQGTSDAPIIFSSTEKWAGSWKGIFIGTHRFENVFSYCKFEYAGNSPIEQMSVPAALGVHQDNNDFLEPVIHVNNCTFDNNNGFAFYCESLNAHIEDFSFNSVFNQQGAPIGLPFKLASSIASNNIFHTPQKPNTLKYVLLFNDGFNQNSDLDQDLTLHKLDLPYRFKGSEGVSIVKAGLSIEPGVVLEFDVDGGLVIKEGFIKAIGTPSEPIVFKGISGSISKWVGISIQTDNSNNILQYCDISSAGSKKAAWCDGQGAITLGNWFGINGKADVSNCRISNSGAYAIDKKNNSALTSSNNTYSLNLLSPDIHTYQ